MRYLVIDEFSMVGQRLLVAIHTRLAQIRQNSEPFWWFMGCHFDGRPVSVGPGEGALPPSKSNRDLRYG